MKLPWIKSWMAIPALGFVLGVYLGTVDNRRAKVCNSLEGVHYGFVWADICIDRRAVISWRDAP